MSDEFLSHLERHVFPGGCFFAAVGAEFDTHPGPVKERIVAFTDEWVGELVAAAAAAQQAGELPADPDPEQVRVVTSDRALADQARFAGALVEPAEAFRREIEDE